MKSRVIVFIPARGGSKSIPLKNIKPLLGRPLIEHGLKAADDCAEVTQIVVSTDSEEIAKVCKNFGSNKITIHNRSAKNASDTSSTESVMLEYLTKNTYSASDLFILLQITNPFIKANDLSQAIKALKKEKADSLLSVVKTKRFFWNNKAQPINYDYKKRPRRQDFAGLWLENGAFYISSIGKILKSKNRLSGKIALYEMPEYTSFEIDEPHDWVIAEGLLAQAHKPAAPKKKRSIKLFLTDVDGVLTDAGMYYTEAGDELKKFNTTDGMGLKLLMKKGIQTGIITSENTQLVERRFKKLKLNHLFQGAQDKLEIAQTLCSQLNIKLDEVAYIGDDINDLSLLKAVGVAACPANAQAEIKSIPGIIQLSQSGGNGAVREFVNLILGQI